MPRRATSLIGPSNSEFLW